MCLIAFAYQVHPRYELVFAGNRDEYYSRPTAPMGPWDDAPEILAGRDLQAGGTWLGITRSGKWGSVTNFRDPTHHKSEARSRGDLVSDYLKCSASPEAFLKDLDARSASYNSFSVVLGDRSSVYFYSSVERKVRALTPGVYGLSNHLLDEPWPKVEVAKRELRKLLDHDALDPEVLFALLADKTAAPDTLLPQTGVDLEIERALSPIFIGMPGYGTRSSSVILTRKDGLVIAERTIGWPTCETRTFKIQF